MLQIFFSFLHFYTVEMYHIKIYKLDEMSI
jgi:hypothetical protein